MHRLTTCDVVQTGGGRIDACPTSCPGKRRDLRVRGNAYAEGFVDTALTGNTLLEGAIFPGTAHRQLASRENASLHRPIVLSARSDPPFPLRESPGRSDGRGFG